MIGRDLLLKTEQQSPGGVKVSSRSQRLPANRISSYDDDADDGAEILGPIVQSKPSVSYVSMMSSCRKVTHISAKKISLHSSP